MLAPGRKYRISECASVVLAPPPRASGWLCGRGYTNSREPGERSRPSTSGFSFLANYPASSCGYSIGYNSGI